MKKLADSLAAVLLAFAAGASAAAAEGPERVGRTIVRVDRGDAMAVVSWHDMADYCRESRWIYLDTVVAPSKGPIPLRRGAIALVLPDGSRVPLATAERYQATAEERRRPRHQTRAGAEKRDPLEGLYRKEPQSTTGTGRAWVCPSFWSKGLDGSIPEEISPEAWKPFRGKLWFESPAGAWPDGSYVLDLGVPGLELPFPLPPSK